MEPHGGDTYGIRADALDFSANINPLGMPESVRIAAEAAVRSSGRYPDPLCRGLRAALERSLGIPRGWIVCGNGAADIIYRLCWALKPRRAVVLTPTFSEYEAALNSVGSTVTRYPSVETILTALAKPTMPASVDMVFLCNPNNPTGLLVDPALMAGIVEKCQIAGVTLVIDESFIDFVENPQAHTLMPELGRRPRLVVLRSFTKMFAMPGLRLGYCASSDAELVTRLYESGPPWAVSAPAMAAGVAALDETGFVSRARALIAREMPRLSDRLRGLGLRVTDGAANFLLVRDDSGADIPSKLAARGIIVRAHTGFHGLDGRYFRVAARLPHENDRLAEALTDILREGDRP
ncbi:MAG: threonine-phosphate decarboxylase CobD [Oscillospiraceae bacterium]|jgi:threonine-phosphate decarboxylase|nr:threonine-phosphate decarboxylase CobD [Oscillospiraceae bacterium]